MKRLLTMVFVFTLASNSGVLGATKGQQINKNTTVKYSYITLNSKKNNCNVVVKPNCNINNNNSNNSNNNNCNNNSNNNTNVDNNTNSNGNINNGNSNNQNSNTGNNSINSNILSIEKEVVELVNKERAKYGLNPLTIDERVSSVARLKSEDMAKNNYFSHTSPTYGSPFNMLKNFNISYKTAGENIAKGQKTAEAVVNAWMNSEGHRANILNPNYTHIGVGYVLKGNTTYWTQMFISK